jgi:hypothetical protein
MPRVIKGPRICGGMATAAKVQQHYDEIRDRAEARGALPSIESVDPQERADARWCNDLTRLVEMNELSKDAPVRLRSLPYRVWNQTATAFALYPSPRSE